MPATDSVLKEELACDDQVLGLGTEPKAYAESILKAVERSFLTDVVHQTASFASRHELERRIDMILDKNRITGSLHQWRYLLLPCVMILAVTWLVMPTATGKPKETGSSLTKEAADGNVSFSVAQSGLPVVETATIWTDTVKRGPLAVQVRALGFLQVENNGTPKAHVLVPGLVSRDIEVGQSASVDTRRGIMFGRVNHIYGLQDNGVFPIDIELKGDLPDGIQAGAEIDATVDIDRLDNVLTVHRPAIGGGNSTFSIFKIDTDGKTATRTLVKSGKLSVNAIEIIDGLKEGDQIILSDMSALDAFNKIALK